MKHGARRVLLIASPLVALLAVGDNLRDSAGSRELGPISFSSIVGKVEV
ncbi:MAG TPA: hypothetical protein VKQ30_15040 [Ktedonobacterales bacterium]|nr:hypothetical protein [Ktedonobacterales bacterium]